MGRIKDFQQYLEEYNKILRNIRQEVPNREFPEIDNEPTKEIIIEPECTCDIKIMVSVGHIDSCPYKRWLVEGKKQG